MAPHSQTKIFAQPEAPIPVSLEEEMFDFDNVSNPSEDQDKDTPVPAKSQYYLVLKDELEVMSSTSTSIISIANNMTVRLGQNFCHCWCLELCQPPALFRDHSPLGLP
jgi:hypothetical protein